MHFFAYIQMLLFYRDDFIIDMLSLERNYILVRCYLLGGPTERVLPPRTLTVVIVIIIL